MNPAFSHMERWQRLFDGCTLEIADIETAHEIVQAGMRELGAGAGHPSHEALTARLHRNPRCVIAFRCAAGHDLYGYAIVLPLTKDAVDDLLSGAIVAGRLLTAEHIVMPGELTAGFYLSVVWSRGGISAAGMTIAGLLNWIEQESASADSSLPVFARAASDSGRRLMRRLGMHPVEASKSEVWLAWMPDPHGGQVTRSRPAR